MNRSKPLQRTPLRRSGTGLSRATGIRQVSAKRARQNRERKAMVTVLYPDRPFCVVYVLAQHNPGVVPDAVLAGCGRWADDVHEPLSRARGGSITDPGNALSPCRACHDVITFRPESELGWAYRAGLLVHSWPGVAS